MKRSNEFQNTCSNIQKSVKKKKWPCLINDCRANAINSHLLQKNGILNTISEDGHLYEIRSKDVFSFEENEPALEFKLVGIDKEALSLPLFCNNHDTRYFKPIETEPINFTYYKTFLLLSYRAVCGEIRKKERNIEFFSRLLNSLTLNSERGSGLDEMKIFLLGTKLGLKNLMDYKYLFEKELHTLKSEFTFQTYVYPLIKVYGSATFSPVDYNTVVPFKEKLLDALFMHIIPYKEKLYIIVGYHNSHSSNWMKDYLLSWQNLDRLSLELKLTDLFAARIESWGMAPDLHRTIDPKRLRRFVEYCHDNAHNLSAGQNPKFNLFEQDQQQKI